MMKNLVVLALVLAVATFASAGMITVRVDPAQAAATYTQGQTIKIQLVTSDFGQEMFSGELVMMNIAAITKTEAGASATVGTLNSGYFGSFKANGILGTGSQLIKDISGTGNAEQIIPNGTVVYSFNFTTGMTAGQYQINLSGFEAKSAFGDAVESAVAPLSYSVVPEPITVALLGLGGLFIRRRKVA